MKRFLIFLAVILAVSGIGGTIYFWFQNKKISGEKETLITQNAQLQSTIDAIGPITTAYTVAASVESGSVIHATDFIEISIPVASLTEETVLDLSEIEGRLYKIDLDPGTTLTTDMIMTNEFSETVYEQDMSFEFLPLGIGVGDYVDIQMTLPYGETLMVIPHKRIEQVVVETATIKVWLTPAQQALWQSAMRDKALYSNIGLATYVTKYVEPGVQDTSVAYYPVRQEMEAVVTLNPNIKNKKECVNSALRKQIDLMIANVEEQEGQRLQTGVNNESSKIKSSVSQYVEEKDNQSMNQQEPPVVRFDETSGLQELDSSVSTIKSDSGGNTSSITPAQDNATLGDDIFNDENVIN